MVLTTWNVMGIISNNTPEKIQEILLNLLISSLKFKLTLYEIHNYINN